MQWGVTVGEVDKIDPILQQLGKVALSLGCLVRSGVWNGKREDLEVTDIGVVRWGVTIGEVDQTDPISQRLGRWPQVRGVWSVQVYEMGRGKTLR